MARKFAPIPCALLDDERYRSMPAEARLAYLSIRCSPRMPLCGVIDWIPRRWTDATGLDVGRLESAFDDIAAAGLAEFDEDTRELLFPEIVAEDARNPNMRRAARSQADNVWSDRLKALVVGVLDALEVPGTIPETVSGTLSGTIVETLPETVSETPPGTYAPPDVQMYRCTDVQKTTSVVTSTVTAEREVENHEKRLLQTTRQEAEQIAEHWRHLLRAKGGHPPNDTAARKRWARDIETLITTTGVAHDRLIAVIEWTTTHQWWASRIRTPADLAKNWDRAQAQFAESEIVIPAEVPF